MKNVEKYIISSVTKISALCMGMFTLVSFESLESPYSVGPPLTFWGFFHQFLK